MKIEKTEVFNIYGAFRGMRNPMNSWEKSTPESDIELACKLVRAGTEHRKFLRQIMVSVDLTLPIYMWSEFDTYKIGVTRNSCSTMHTLTKRLLTVEDFEPPMKAEYLHNINQALLQYMAIINSTYGLDEHDKKLKEETFQLIKGLLPSAFLQKATITANYEVLLTMYQQRKNHRLPQWHTICEWIAELPMMSHFINILE